MVVFDVGTVDLSVTNYLTKGTIDVSYIANLAQWFDDDTVYADDIKIYQQNTEAQALTLTPDTDVDPANAEIAAELVFDLDASTLSSADKIKVTAGATTVSPTAIEFDPMEPNKFTMKFDAGVLAGSTTYTVSFDESVKDLFGTSVAATATFTTAAGEEPEPAETVALTASATGAGTVAISGGSTGATVTDEVELGAPVTLTATAEANETFLFWVDAAGRILSREASYTITPVSEETVTAVFTSSASGSLAVFVNGRSQQVAQITNGSTATVPEAPYVMGYTFTSWLKDGETQDIEAGGSVDVSGNVEYVAAYARSEDTYEVTVTGGTGSGEYRYNDVVTAVANAAEAGKKFSHWTKDGATVSYDTTYKFYASGASEVTAVYVEESEPVEKKPILVASMSEGLVDDDKLAFFSERDLPSEWEIVETGLLLGQDEATLELGADGVTKAAARNTDAKGQYTVRKAGVSAGEVWYGRAYVVYREDGELKVMYSDVVGNNE